MQLLPDLTPNIDKTPELVDLESMDLRGLFGLADEIVESAPGIVDAIAQTVAEVEVLIAELGL